MGISWAWYGVLLYLALFPTPFPISVRALPGGYLTVNSSTSWTNTLSAPDSVKFNDGSFVNIILSLNRVQDHDYACGLQLTSERGLVLQDANGTIAWSTNISSKSVAALNLTDMCNLWVAGQNLTSQGGLYLLSLTSEGLFAYINSNPPQCYFSYNPDNVSFSYLQFHNQSLDFFRVNEPSPRPLSDSAELPITSKYMRFGPDGHLRVYDSYWGEVVDLLKDIGNCRYPTACGNYGMPTRYSYHDLQAMTENFSKELGAGGFGTVFEGTSIDGIKVAVKRLDGLSQIKKSFLAEVETIGSIHHFNLVRLIGFCAEKSHRLLVYEYMSNGSLDRWVLHKNPENEDMQLHGAEVVNMMRVAARCLQIDYTKRPSMSMVVKVLEDVENVESDLDYFFWNPPLPNMGAGVDNP
uniref:Protein kinase domain-containing protein n=1 Tax=Fagus sylvatica TaxID=28930 RepID=A0A2N9H7J5_FAGSY